MIRIIVFALAFLLGLAQARAQVSFDATASGATAGPGTAPVTNSMTPGGAANTVGLACLALQVSTITDASCNWDSTGANTPMTKLEDVPNAGGGNNGRSVLFGVPLGTPAASAKTISCSWTGASGSKLDVATFKGASQSVGTAFPSHPGVNATGNSAAVSLSITSAANHASMDCGTTVQNFSAPTQTNIVTDTTGCCSIGMSRASGATATFAWTVSPSAQWVDVGTDIAPPAAGGTSSFLNLTGVGQ